MLSGGRLATKSADGRIIVWDLSAAAKTQLASWKVPGCAAGDGARGRFGTTCDGNVLVAGSTGGDVFAYDAATGEKLATFSTGKARHLAWICLHSPGKQQVCDTCLCSQVRAPVLACAVTDDCRNVLAVFGAGLIARWEVISAAPAGSAIMAGEDE